VRVFFKTNLDEVRPYIGLLLFLLLLLLEVCCVLRFLSGGLERLWQVIGCLISGVGTCVPVRRFRSV
jgi:hypothetical protein